jgi:deoxycytidylate deaminase
MSDILIQKVKVILNEGHCCDAVKAKVNALISYTRMNDTDLGHQSNDLTKALE